MPPKPKFRREEIIDAAYDLMEEGGMDAVVAREVGKRLGCTVAPLFTCFENMEELRQAVHKKALAAFSEAMRDCVDYFPAFKEFGLRWVRLAKEHPHVYGEVFLRRDGASGETFVSEDLWTLLAPILAEIEATFGISVADAERLMNDMLIYVHGLAAIQVGGHGEVSEETVRVSLSRLCISYVAGIQARDGCLNAPQLREMMAHLDMMPVRKNDVWKK